MTSTIGRPERAPVRHVARFGPLRIEYDDRVLRPRPWTVRQARWAAELLTTAPPGPVLELCCGAGQIGLLAVASARRRLVAVDLDAVACDHARHNAAAAGLSDRVEVREADLDAAVRDEERFAVVVADPPYLRADEVGGFPEDPRLAVDGGEEEGLAVARRCVAVARDHLLPGGSALLQLRSSDQAARIRDLVDEEGMLAVAGWRSYGRGVVALLRHA